MWDYLKAATPRRSRPSTPSTPRLSSSGTSSEAFWDPGNDGSKGFVAEGVPNQRASEVYIGGRPSTTGSAREEPERGRQLYRKPLPTGYPVAGTSTTTRDKLPGDSIGTGHTGFTAPTDRDRDHDRLVQHNTAGDSPHPPASNLKHQHDNLPLYSDGVPSKGLFSRTRGHYRVAGASMLPVAKLPDQYTRMSDKESRYEQAEGRPGAAQPAAMSSALGGRVGPPTKGQRAKAHLKKWWWLHLLIAIIIIVVVVIIIIFVAIPKIAQSRVNGATLKIQGIQLSQTQADNYTLAINATIQADDSIHAVIDAFDGVMYLEDWPPQTPFARIAFPSVTSAAMTAINISQFTEILDLNAFTVFNEYFLVNESINVSVEGDSMIKVAGVNRKYPVTFKKTINMPALSNFNGTTVPTSRIALPADADGNNFFGTVVIPNRSYITFEIGNTSYINFMLGQNVGTIYIDDVTLHPGNNTFSLQGNVSQTPVLQTIQERPYCETGDIPFQLQGLNVTNHGQHLSYYTQALASTNTSVSIDVRSDLEALGLTINCTAQ